MAPVTPTKNVPWETLEERDTQVQAAHNRGTGVHQTQQMRYGLTGRAMSWYMACVSSLLRYLVKHNLGLEVDGKCDADPSVVLDFKQDRLQCDFDGWVASRRVAFEGRAHALSGDGNAIRQALALMWYPHSEHLAPIANLVTMAWRCRGDNSSRDKARRLLGGLEGFLLRNMVPWNVIRDANGTEADRVIKAYEHGTATNGEIQSALMTSLMTDLPPVRGGLNYGRMLIVEGRPTLATRAVLPGYTNVLFREGGRYFRGMYWFKNHGAVGDTTLETDVPVELGNSARINRLLDMRMEMQPGGYLLVSLGKWARSIAGRASIPPHLPDLGTDGTELLVRATRSNLGEAYEKHRVNFQVYRVSHDSAVIPMLDPDQFVLLARLMMHSEAVAITYQKKNSSRCP